MQSNIKRKLPLLVGVGLPLFLVLWVVVFAYFLPKIFVKPIYNFIYVTGYDAKYVNVYNQRVQPDPYLLDREDISGFSGLDFYLYDVQNEENIPLTLDEARSYRLDSSEKSIDGYIVRSKKDEDFFFFPFFWDSNRGYYINKNTTWAKQIFLKGDYYYFKWLGWVLNE